MFKKRRLFLKPKPNYEADDYIEFCETSLLYEPPFTKTLSEVQLKAYFDTKARTEHLQQFGSHGKDYKRYGRSSHQDQYQRKERE